MVQEPYLPFHPCQPNSHWPNLGERNLHYSSRDHPVVYKKETEKKTWLINYTIYTISILDKLGEIQISSDTTESFPS